MSQRICVIVGASSAIASATGRLLAAQGWGFHLISRSKEKNEAVAADLRAYGASQVTSAEGELAALSQLSAAALGHSLPDRVEMVLFAAGILGNQERAQKDAAHCREVLETNYLYPVLFLNAAAEYLVGQGRGTLVVLSSVAGERGRRSNYIYGSCKAGLSAYLEGLSARLHGSGVQLCEIRPGMVATPMTAHLPRSPLLAAPERVAEQIVGALSRGREMVYAPGYWYWIMLVIRWIPRRLFKRLPL